LSKIVDNIIAEIIGDVFKKDGMIDCNQFGFTKGKKTCQAF